jgi:hypothetical protein
VNTRHCNVRSSCAEKGPCPATEDGWVWTVLRIYCHMPSWHGQPQSFEVRSVSLCAPSANISDRYRWRQPRFGQFCASTVMCRDSVCFSHFTLSVSLYAPSAVDPDDISSHKPTFLSHSRRVRFQKQTVKCSRFKLTKMEIDRETWIELHFYTEKSNRHEKLEARFYKQIKLRRSKLYLTCIWFNGKI